jgi:hypothetical protein
VPTPRRPTTWRTSARTPTSPCWSRRGGASPTEEYLPLCQGIARHKAADARRRLARRHLTNAAAALSEADDTGPEGGNYARLVGRMSAAEREEFGAVLAELLTALPPRQRLVAELYVLHFEEFRPRATFDVLAGLVSGVSGQPERPDTVKGDWHAARAKLRAGLARRGYLRD